MLQRDVSLGKVAGQDVVVPEEPVGVVPVVVLVEAAA